MQPVKSIICFNSGSGGDFLKIICNEQLVNYTEQYCIHPNGMVDLENNNFKHVVEEVFYNRATVDSLNNVDNNPVENTHYYIDIFTELTPNLFYIDYPDELNPGIIEVYVAKRMHGSNTTFFNSFKSSLHPKLQDRLTLENLYQSSNINWGKNLKTWRANKNLQAIQLSDFFNKEKFYNIIKQLTGLNSLDNDKFLKTYKTWVDNNNYLKEMFTNAIPSHHLL